MCARKTNWISGGLRHAALSLALLPALAGGAMSQGAGPLFGAWCNDLGDPALYIEADGLGFGEHRQCSWDKVPGRAVQHQSRIHCKPSGGSGAAAMIAEKSYDFSAVLISQGVLRARLGDGATVMSFTYSPCDP